ncbi:MAG: 16S rRNA (adenine(1518)-N(6)/adenine(1519)-N(6))-dimethyltransferase RsmA [Planctomycetota bacterium]
MNSSIFMAASPHPDRAAIMPRRGGLVERVRRRRRGKRACPDPSESSSASPADRLTTLPDGRRRLAGFLARRDAARYARIMQTLSEIRGLLDSAGLAPRRRLGQNFLIDRNLMGKLLDLAGPLSGRTVLEVGAATGSLTEELLARCADEGGRVVAVEADPRLAGLLRRRLADARRLTLLQRDVLAGKHEIADDVLDATGPRASLVSNLPYNVATPLVAEALAVTWRTRRGRARTPCAFDRLTFTVQQEVADRLAAAPGCGAYGPVTVAVALLGRVSSGPAVPPEAFWPRPKVASRMLRIDYDERDAPRDLDVLRRLVATAFAQRRKRIGSLAKRCGADLDAGAVAAALEVAGIDPDARPEAVAPGRYRAAADALSSG